MYLAFKTIRKLVHERRRADCCANVARVLDPGGTFAIETWVPDPCARCVDQVVRCVRGPWATVG